MGLRCHSPFMGNRTDGDQVIGAGPVGVLVGGLTSEKWAIRPYRLARMPHSSPLSSANPLRRPMAE